MKMKTMIRSSLIALVAIACLVPCTFAAPGGKQLTFGLVTKALDNPFWSLMKDGAEKVAEANGAKLIYLAPTKANNLEEQTRLVEDLIQRKVDGIVLVPVDSAGIVPVIERANKAGIPIALANTNANGGQVVTFSAIENYDAMTIVTEFVMSKLGGKGKVIILEGAPGAQTTTDRLRAMTDVIKKYPGITLLASQPADNQRAKGMQVMDNLLQTYTTVDAILCNNDEEALGAIEALDSAGRLGKTMVAGFDGNDDALNAISQGRMLVSMNQNPQKQAADALQALIDIIAGKSVPKRIVTQGILLTKDNVALYLPAAK
jgi:ribose transport system substrate-binding protein